MVLWVRIVITIVLAIGMAVYIWWSIKQWKSFK